MNKTPKKRQKDENQDKEAFKPAITNRKILERYEPDDDEFDRKDVAFVGGCGPGGG
jgi:hypothetical protein